MIEIMILYASAREQAADQVNLMKIGQRSTGIFKQRYGMVVVTKRNSVTVVIAL